MIRIVQKDEIGSLRPLGKAHAFKFEVSESLGKAIRYFILCIAAKEVRGLGGDHASMLVHTSMLTTVHEEARLAVEPYVNELIEQLLAGDETLNSELRELWRDECEALPAEKYGLKPVGFDEIQSRIAECARSLEIKVENWISSDRIDYQVPGRRYLVIGGNVLARGLTLEGLMVSLFMRTSSQYDTLMQMGRWFGYRRGFEDLPRIWMEAGVQTAFFQLATVEEEIRRDIRYYSQHNVTPAEFAVRIRKIPGMMITNRNRLRHTVRAQVGYAGRHLQTIRFCRSDDDWLSDNWSAGERLLRRSDPVRTDRLVFKADSSAVLAFLGEYKVHPENSGLDAGLLVQYIRQTTDSSLQSWHVVVVTTGQGKLSEIPLGDLGHVRCNNRSAMKGSGDDASIKALMSKRDLLLDLDPIPETNSEAGWEELKAHRRGVAPLLLLYPIDRNSSPQTKSTDREDLAAAHEVLGLGVVLPGDAQRSHDYVTTNLTPIEPDEEPVEEIPREVLEA